MNFIKNIKSRYNEFLDYIDESEEVFVNRKNQIVAIVEMITPFKFFFYNLFFTLTKDIVPTKEDYFRLYPNEAENMTFELPKAVYDENDEWTLGYILKHNS